MSQHLISRGDAERDLLAAATFLAENIRSGDGRAAAMLAVVPHYLARRDVDLAAELANTVDDPYTRDRLLIMVAEKCAEINDDEYALQLADAVEDEGMRAEALERVALKKVAGGDLESAKTTADEMVHPDSVLAAVAVAEMETGNADAALETIRTIDFPEARVTAYHSIAARELSAGNKERAVEMLDLAAADAVEIPHDEERIRAIVDVGNGFIRAGRNDRAVETFEKARAFSEELDNIHRDAFLAAASLGFLHAGSVEFADRTLDAVADKTQIAFCLLGFAREFWTKGERDEAIEALEESYAILRSQKESETRNSRERFGLFGQIAAQFAGFEKGERAIEIANAIEEENAQTSALVQVAEILTLRKEYDEARHALTSIGEDSDRLTALIRMSDAHARNEEHDKALELIDEAEHLAETVPQLGARSQAYNEIAARYAAADKLDKADENALRSLETAAAIRDESSRVESLARLAEVVEQGGLKLSDAAKNLVATLVARG